LGGVFPSLRSGALSPNFQNRALNIAELNQVRTIAAEQNSNEI
jgi:hypothetical protein